MSLALCAIIGGKTSRFKPFTDLYREAGKQAGYLPDQLKIGVHSLGLRSRNYQRGSR